MSEVKPHEKVLWEDNPFWLNFFWHIIILLILDVIGIISSFVIGSFVINQIIPFALFITFTICLVVLGFWAFIQIVKWKSIHYMIKQDEIIFEKGIITKEKLTILVDKIEFYRVNINLVDRLWGTGDILIFTGEEQDVPEATLHDVDHVKKVEEVIKTILSA
ncbi:MAG: PH domain-containing protein [Promethearchaeota archaeon]|nr:MAG: PH domain-containing protein [Candidatus Lokiarchaeota archaeon]